MNMTSIALAAALLAAPAAITSFDLGGSASAQAQGRGGGGSSTGGGGAAGDLESPRGIALFAAVPSNQRVPPSTVPPQFPRRSSPAGLCANQFGEPGRMDCQPR